MYIVVLTDTNNGCSNTAEVNVTEIDLPIGMIESIAHATCFGDASGYATLSGYGWNGNSTPAGG